MSRHGIKATRKTTKLKPQQSQAFFYPLSVLYCMPLFCECFPVFGNSFNMLSVLIVKWKKTKTPL